MPAMSALAEAVPETEAVAERKPWEGVLGTIGSPTSDGRYLVPGEITNRDLPVHFNVQPALDEAHKGARNAGSIEEIEYIPWDDFERKEEFYAEDQLEKIPADAVVIWGVGSIDDSEWGEEALRQIQNGADVSLDGLRYNGKFYDPTSFEEIDISEMDLGDVMMSSMEGEYLNGVVGKIGGVTVVGIGAFEEARVIVTASGSLRILTPEEKRSLGLVATGGPLKPPRLWFENPHLTELTPLQITKEGRVFGHLCDWDGCHVGFQGICMPPFRSPSNYANFNVGEIECDDGSLMPHGKLMFSRDGVGHAPLNREITAEEVRAHYDNATCVGAFVRAGEDKFGTWLAGALRSDLNDLEIQHLRTHPPSGDWRPIKGQNDLLAAFAVPVPGFPIQRALVASADGLISGIISAPLVIDHELGAKRRFRQRTMLVERAAAALGHRPSSRARMRREMVIAKDVSHKAWYSDLKEYPQETRKRMAKSGTAMPDGSYPIADCEDVNNARRAIGRTPPARRAAVRRHIAKRANALGCK
jgi:hypothetical protein